MNTDKIIKSIQCIEFVNKINSLANKLLYDSNDGFIYLKSKNSLLNREKILEKFSFEADKIKQELNFSEDNGFIDEKKEELKIIISKHCNAELPFWIDEVFDELISNFLFSLSVNKELKDEIYFKILESLAWYANVKNISIEERKKIENKLIADFESCLNSSDKDYLDTVSLNRTDYKIYFQIWEEVLLDLDKFLKYDFSDFENKLLKNDINYFLGVQSRLNSYKKTVVLDDFSLIKAAIDFAKIADEKEKYDFIQDIRNDFIYSLEQNKQLSEEEKIKIVKRRITLAQSKKDNLVNYYSKIISGLNE